VLEYLGGELGEEGEGEEGINVFVVAFAMADVVV
jgi:hypothetical protein